MIPTIYPDCYYAAPSCEGDLWECETCGEHFCQTHWHETENGRNVECVGCERSRIQEKHGYSNIYQKVACETYPDGDLLPLDLEDGVSVAGAVKTRETGDTLFDFVFLELNDSDLTQEDAIERIAKAVNDLQRVVSAIEEHTL